MLEFFCGCTIWHLIYCMKLSEKKSMKNLEKEKGVRDLWES